MVGKRKKTQTRSRVGGQSSSQFYKRGTSIASDDVVAALKKRRASQSQAKIDLRKSEAAESRKRFSYIGIVLVIVVIFGVLQFISGVSLKNPKNASDEQKAALLQLADNYFSEHPLSRFRLLFNQAQLAEVLKRQTPMLDTVKVRTSPISRKVTLEATYRTPSFVWQDLRHGKSYVVDHEGVVVGDADGPSTEGLPLLIDNSGLEPELSKAVISANDATFLSKLFAGLVQLNLPLKQVELTNEPKQYRVLLSDRKYYLKVTTARPIDGQLEDLKPVLKLLEGRGMTPSSYIDVRVKDKAFYK